MKIESYNVRMDSAEAKSVASTRKLWVGYTQGKYTPNSLTENSFSGTFDSLQNKEEENADTNKTTEENNTTSDLWERYSSNPPQNIQNIRSSNSGSTVRDIQSVKQQFVLYLWRLLFGEEKAKNLQEKYGLQDLNQSGFAGTYQDTSSMQLGQQTQTITLYGVSESYYLEEQNTSFSSQGTVTTSDGRTIDFNVNLQMSSRFESYYREESLDAISMCDPLVLNFEGDVADLSDMTFMFDLDADGTEEEISMLSSGNGFLAYDVNEDGIINDGAELFGVKSGDGFADLSFYDSDNNGWIDENDDIFDKLKIWTKSEDGNDILLNLKDKGVGAIYLGNADTDFTLRNNNGDVKGAIRKTGIFLYENAAIGTMVHLDIAN